MLRGLRSCSRGVVGSTAAFRTFSSSSVLFEKIDLTPFTKDNGGLKPTSKWHLEQLKQFCDLGFKSSLGFTKQQLAAVTLRPEAEVFAKCSIGTDEIEAGVWDSKLDMTGVPVEAKCHVKTTVNATFSKLQYVLYQHAFAKDLENEPRPDRRKIDPLAMRLAVLCGFDDGEDFDFTTVPISFKMAGRPINSKVDVYVASRHMAPGQVVLIWQDKLGKRNSHISQGMLRDSAAQIIGELLAVHYHNYRRKNFEPAEVYAVRLIDDMVAFFRMEMSAEQIKAVCDDGVIPNPKLQVDYVPMDALDAGNEYGVSLLHPVGRDWFVRMMACIRAEILKREVPESVPFKSQKDGKDADPDKL